MSDGELLIHPIARGAAAIAGTLGALICPEWLALAIAWAVVVLPLSWRGTVLKGHLRFAVLIVIPIMAALLAVWGWIVGAAPHAPLHSDSRGGIDFALLVSFRLLVVGGIWQLTFLTMSPSTLVHTLRSWGLRGDSLLAAICTFTVLPDVRLRADRILTARKARGLGSSSKIGTARNLPHVLVPLVSWALRSAIERGRALEQRGLLERYDDIDHFPPGSDFRTLPTLALVILAAGWLMITASLLLWR